MLKIRDLVGGYPKRKALELGKLMLLEFLMPFSIGIPIGLLMIFIGIVVYFWTKRQSKIWLSITILGALITLSTLGLIVLAVNSM